MTTTTDLRELLDTFAPNAETVEELVELVEDDFDNAELTGELLWDIRNEYGVDTAKAVIHEVGVTTGYGAYHFAQLIRDHAQKVAAKRGMRMSMISEARILEMARA